jgi:hypothetical protein
MKYGTRGMALLAVLGNFKNGAIADFDSNADRDCQEVKSFGCDVFGKVARSDITSHGLHRADTLQSQQAHLAVGIGAGVGIPEQASMFNKLAHAQVLFAHTGPRAQTYGMDNSLL